MTAYAIDDGRGARRAGEADFPLSVGGPETDVQVDADAGAARLAYLGLSDGKVFVQPGGDHYRVVVNGTALAASHWLEDGDVVSFGAARLTLEATGGETRFVVRGTATDRPTDPPLIAPPARRAEPEAVAAGAATVQPVHFEPRRSLAAARPRSGIRPFGVLATLALLALIAVAVFLFASRSVLIEIEPPPDRLAFEDGFAFELGGRHLVRPGTYVLRAEKAGFSPFTTALEVTRERNQTFRFALEKLPGRLLITSPVEGAEVLVDGERLGTTPLGAVELPPGEHQITVRAERYRDFSTRLEVAGGGATQTLDADLAPRWAPVSFASQPAGARLRLDGEEIGTTPLTADVLDGDHAFELVLAGHKPHRGRVQVTALEPQTVDTVRLAPSDGNLVITSQPTGAAVTVGGVYRGEAPLDLFLEPNRDYPVGVSKAGYESHKETVRVASGQSREIAVTLAAQEGEVQVSSWPPDAELFVDGEPRGAGNQALKLPAVAHVIEVRKAGFATHRQSVTPLPGVPQWIEVTLKPAAEARAEAGAAAKRQAYENPAGHRMRLIAPGRLRMGASRREPGRRANEVLREVELTRRYYLGAHEVSNRQFRKFDQDHFSGQAGGHNLEIDHHPAVRVTWQKAAEYCNWLSRQENLALAYVDRGGQLAAAVPMTTGYRLPTEAEWAWAARYGDGETGRKYPWGEALPVPAGAGNYADASAEGSLPGTISGYNDSFPATAPVDSFSPDARGFYNLGGNVAEWVHDFYAIHLGGSSEIERDPMGPAEGEYHVIRGSSWMHSTVTELRLSFRDYGSEARPDVGFRVARYAE